MRRLICCAVGVSLCLAMGCGPQVRKPNFLHPGNAAQQRWDAIYHDPYPLNDVAPEIVGGRPRGYQNPVPEVLRAQPLQPATLVSPPAVR